MGGKRLQVGGCLLSLVKPRASTAFQGMQMVNGNCNITFLS